jgi:cytochrome c
MYKSYHKKIISTAVLTSAVLFTTACNASNEESKAPAAKPAVEAATPAASGFSKRVTDAVGPANAAVSDTVKKTYEHNGKLAVDGGVVYPVVNSKTGSYYVNEEAHKTPFSKGRTATANEQARWNIDVMPNGDGLPEGEGSVEFGDEVYEEKCASCHGDFGAGAGLYPRLTAGNAYEMHKTLMYQRTDPEHQDGPQRVFGSNWPYASTLWWYIKTGMPHQAPMTLTTEEVYALVAYILYINEMKIDGELVDDEYVLDREKFLKIVMPNVDGFEPDINGPQGQDNARAYYNEPLNYGNGTRCMKDCFEGEPELQRIAQALTDFSPPLSAEKSLPEPAEDAKAEHPGKKGYEKSCGMCHDSGAAGAPITGNKDEWAKVMEKGIDAVYANGINGIGGMPPKGGAMSLSDEQFKQITDYMIESSK